MGGIKSFLLKSLGFVFLSIAYLALLFAVTIFFIDDELKSFQSTAVSAVSPIFGQMLEKQYMAEGDLFEQAKAMCSLQSSEIEAAVGSELPIDVKALCNEIASGKIKSKADINKYLASGMLKKPMEEFFIQLKPKIEMVKNIGNLLFFVFFVSFLVSALLIFLDNMNLGVFIRTFFFQSFVLSFLNLITLGAFWLISPTLMNLAINMLVGKAGGETIPQEMLSMVNSVIPPILEWLRAYVMKPLVLFCAITIVSAVGWITGFGTKKDGLLISKVPGH